MFGYITRINEREICFGKKRFIEKYNLNYSMLFLISHLFSIYEQFFVTEYSHISLDNIKRNF